MIPSVTRRFVGPILNYYSYQLENKKNVLRKLKGLEPQRISIDSDTLFIYKSNEPVSYRSPSSVNMEGNLADWHINAEPMRLRTWNFLQGLFLFALRRNFRNLNTLKGDNCLHWICADEVAGEVLVIYTHTFGKIIHNAGSISAVHLKIVPQFSYQK